MFTGRNTVERDISFKPSRGRCIRLHSVWQWGSPSASDPRAKNTGQRATKGTVLTSQSLSPWCDCRRSGSTWASWRWQGINVGNPLWRRALYLLLLRDAESAPAGQSRVVNSTKSYRGNHHHPNGRVLACQQISIYGFLLSSISSAYWSPVDYGPLQGSRQQAPGTSLHQGNTALLRFYRNKVNKWAKRLNKVYYNQRLGTLCSSSGRWWSDVDEITGRAKPKSRSGLQGLANSLCHDNMKELARNINSFLQLVTQDFVSICDQDNFTIGNDLVECQTISSFLCMRLRGRWLASALKMKSLLARTFFPAGYSE